MEFENITELLDTLNYRYQIRNNQIDVNLERGLICKIKSDNDICSLKGLLTNWNLITGIFPLNIERTPLLISAWSIILIVTFYATTLSDFIPEIVLFLIIIWAYFWCAYYWIRFYSFKSTIETILALNSKHH